MRGKRNNKTKPGIPKKQEWRKRQNESIRTGQTTNTQTRNNVKTNMKKKAKQINEQRKNNKTTNEK